MTVRARTPLRTGTGLVADIRKTRATPQPVTSRARLPDFAGFCSMAGDPAGMTITTCGDVVADGWCWRPDRVASTEGLLLSVEAERQADHVHSLLHFGNPDL